MRRRAVHPFTCRLAETSKFPHNNPESLIGTGFVSMALAIFTAFRPTPILLLMIMWNVRSNAYDLYFFAYYGVFIYIWLALIFLVLFIGGLTMACSRRIKKRCVLLIHPWALLILYFDAFFWLSITIYLHVISLIEDSTHFEHLLHPLVYFVFTYIDIAIFSVIHYLFATYFIIAQLTVIEKFF